MVKSHHTTVLESLEKMLDMYRQRCFNQSAEIQALKQALRGTIPAKRSSHGERVRSKYVPSSSCYIDDMAEELDQALERNEHLEEDITRLHNRLQIEQEWRYAAMEWMESDRRMHKRISKVLHPGRQFEAQKNPIVTSYQQSLNKVIEKSRELDQNVTDMLS